MRSQYEFNEQENQITGTLARLLKIVGVLFAISGLFGLLYYAIGDEALAELMLGEITEIHSVLIALILIIVGITFYRPTDNLQRIVSTQGNDIQDLMTALKELSAGFNIIMYLFIVLVVMELIIFLGSL